MAMREPGCNRAGPYLPSQHLSDPVSTDVDAHPREGRLRGATSGGPKSIQVRKTGTEATKQHIAEFIGYHFNDFTYF